MMSKENYNFSWGEFVFFILILLVCEKYQVSLGESMENFLVHFFFFSIYIFVVLTFKRFQSAFILLFIVYEAVETLSYQMTGHDIDFQVLSSFEFSYVWNAQRIYLFYGGIIFVFAVLISNVKFPHLDCYISSTYLILLVIAESVIFFLFSSCIFRSFYPFGKRYVFRYSKKQDGFDDSELTDEEILLKYIRSKAQTGQPASPKKNIILFAIESFEQQSIGRFNHYYPNMMPFIDNLSQRGTYFTNVICHPYTQWSVGSLLAAQCNLPHVVTEVVWDRMQYESIGKWPQLPCIGKHLKNLGYNLYMEISSQSELMGYRDFFVEYEFEVSDAKEHGQKHDYGFYKYIEEKMFEEKKFKEPFLLMVTNSDTHPFFYVNQECKSNPMYNRNLPHIVNCFNCYDLCVRDFFNRFEKSSLFSRTEMLVYGDHLAFGGGKKIYDNPRKMSIFFPYWEKKVVNKETSVYDIAPTVMDILGVDYSPKYPFGASLMDDKEVGKTPNHNDFTLIYDVISKNVEGENKGRNSTCLWKKGICTGEEYFQDRESVFKS
ncbi:hypothetical protein TRFO_25678 [Tritrichomonas foetus]|uniref:Sulfatase N-terminal domain-containing protein n=1 Tax=Tritrichomonas foetus TaxID=1144522 RepID=A0A1J4K497_9EUKA|nr:hypothetical protein TRFO_25678 [Tritrichomonas foetus]|eukprot:OHT06273.1 hypothetical protein TRFO_25678 [Tritrichomonas foetus]